MDNIYYILSTTDPGAEEILKHLHTIYAKFNGRFVPTFNADKSLCFVRMPYWTALPKGTETAVVREGDKDWAILNVRLDDSWERAEQPREEDVKAVVEGRKPLAELVTSREESPVGDTTRR